jgi:hypothetical protein
VWGSNARLSTQDLGTVLIIGRLFPDLATPRAIRHDFVYHASTDPNRPILHITRVAPIEIPKKHDANKLKYHSIYVLCLNGRRCGVADAPIGAL